MTRSGIIIGIGNELRRDDAVGLAVAAMVRCHAAEVVQLSGEPTELIDVWARRPFAIVIDAIAGEGEPGSVEVVKPETEGTPWPTAAHGTHDIGPVTAVQLGAALDMLPGELVIVGVHGADFTRGEGLSSTVADAVPEVAAMVLAIAARLLETRKEGA